MSFQLDIIVGTWNVNSQEPVEEVRKTIVHQTHLSAYNNTINTINNNNNNNNSSYSSYSSYSTSSSSYNSSSDFYRKRYSTANYNNFDSQLDFSTDDLSSTTTTTTTEYTVDGSDFDMNNNNNNNNNNNYINNSNNHDMSSDSDSDDNDTNNSNGDVVMTSQQSQQPQQNKFKDVLAMSETLRLEEQEYRAKNSLVSDIEKWLLLDQRCADVYAIGFQEVEMTGKALVTEQTDQKLKWEHTLKTVFSKQKEEYTMLCIHQLVGLCLVVFVKRKLVPSIDNVKNCIIREGLSGVLGNKGSIAVRFDLHDLGLCFINCHLAAHQKNIVARNNNLNSILSTTRFVNAYTGHAIAVSDHPLTFVFGDFNYRIDNSVGNWNTAEIQQKIEDGRLKFLLKFDQLSTELKKDHLQLHKLGFVEGDINFAPTYKYITGSDVYDSERNAEKIGKVKSTSKIILGTVKKKKDRIPSWTDRVFYRNVEYENLKCVQQVYNRSESRFSDHKPVFASFNVSYSQSGPAKITSATSSAAPPPVPKHLLAQKRNTSNGKLIDLDDENPFDDTSSNNRNSTSSSRSSGSNSPIIMPSSPTTTTTVVPSAATYDASITSSVFQPTRKTSSASATISTSKVQQLRTSFGAMELTKSDHRTVTTTSIDSAFGKRSSGSETISSSSYVNSEAAVLVNQRLSTGKAILPQKPSEVVQQQQLSQFRQQQQQQQQQQAQQFVSRQQAPQQQQQQPMRTPVQPQPQQQTQTQPKWQPPQKPAPTKPVSSSGGGFNPRALDRSKKVESPTVPQQPVDDHTFVAQFDETPKNGHAPRTNAVYTVDDFF